MRLSVMVAHDESGADVLDRPRRREAARVNALFKSHSCNTTTARKRTLDAVKLAHANAPFEPPADSGDFNYFDSAALCATRKAERRQVKSGRTKRRWHHRQ